jgi:hypothetical protein
MTTAAKIRKLLKEGKTAPQIAKALKIKVGRVYTVAWQEKKKAKVMPEQHPDPSVREAEKKYVKKVNKLFNGLPKSVSKQVHDIKAESWRAANPWFGVIEDRTLEALKYHEQLIEAGITPYTEKYWDKMEMRFNFKPKTRMMSAIEETNKDVGKLFNEAYEKYKDDDTINHPLHYRAGGVETIDFIEAKDLNYRLGNVVKYVSRAGKKASDPLEDLKKAAWYLQREIAAREQA